MNPNRAMMKLCGGRDHQVVSFAVSIFGLYCDYTSSRVELSEEAKAFDWSMLCEPWWRRDVLGQKLWVSHMWNKSQLVADNRNQASFNENCLLQYTWETMRTLASGLNEVRFAQLLCSVMKLTAVG